MIDRVATVAEVVPASVEAARRLRVGRIVALATVLALVLTVFPPAGQLVVYAHPETLSETLTELAEVDSSPVGLAQERSGEAPSDAASRSEIVETELTFNMLGVVAPAGATVVRARTADGDSWGYWHELALFDDEDGPDPGSDEYAAAEDRVAGGVATEPLWVGEATHLQLEVEGADVGDLEVTIIDSLGSSGGPTIRTYETRPANEANAAEFDVVSRAAWGADESLRNGSPRYASEVHMGVVHHTAHSSDLSVANGYSRSEAPAIMRAMYRYHTQSLGWADLGYNVVIDRFGTIYEGRAGGFTRSVIGAHAANFNTGSFGVSVMGNFLRSQASPAAIESLQKVIGVKSAIHGIDPEGWTNEMSGSTWRPTILGHRDVGNTSCPGLIHELLPEIRKGASEFSMRFPDVLTSSPHRGAILELADAGVTNGCSVNLFCPDLVLNRAQASSFVLRALEIDPVPGSRFSDVESSNVHAPAINALAERGWLIGYDDGTFRPREQMTRGQLATLLSRALELPPPLGAVEHYPDVPSSHAHVNGINALSEAGIRGNCGGDRFCPDDLVLRNSTASFVNMVRHYLDPPSLQSDGTEDEEPEDDPDTLEDPDAGHGAVDEEDDTGS